MHEHSSAHCPSPSLHMSLLSYMDMASDARLPPFLLRARGTGRSSLMQALRLLLKRLLYSTLQYAGALLLPRGSVQLIHLILSHPIPSPLPSPTPLTRSTLVQQDPLHSCSSLLPTAGRAEDSVRFGSRHC